MTSDEQRRFEALLLEYHEALLAGQEPVVPEDLPLEIFGQLRDAQKCVARLHVLWAPGSGSELDEVAGQESISADAPIAAWLGTTIGRFKIERELGVGGAGIVLLALDPKLGRHVALKVPRPEGLLSRELHSRFLREAEAAARLKHRHIVAVYEVGESGPVCYIASEYCVGPSLATWLHQHRSAPPREAAALVADLASAVHHAHARGVLHRDLKPSNVMLDRPSSNRGDCVDASALLSTFHPKIADFGLAKLLESDGDETRTGTVLGTPRYMAPEQAEGKVRDIGIHTDIFALGTILYELLSGAPPHVGTSDGDTLRRVLLQEPASLRKKRRDVSADLEAICLKCLEKSPQARYATAAELEDDLRRFLSEQPTLARPLGTAARLWKWTRRRPLIAGLSAVLVAALATILVGAVVYDARLRAALNEANQQREVAQDSARRSRQLLYTADMRRAFEAWKNESTTQVLEILDEQIPRNDEEDHREFSWYFLKGLCHRQQLSFAAHEGDVFGVAWSPDGSLLASGGKDHAVRLWDAATGQSRGMLTGHSDEVTRVAFSPAGDMLATASEDRSLRLWTVPAGEPRGVLRGHVNDVMCLAYSPDGRWLASSSRDRTVRVWNAASGEAITTLATAKEYVSSVEFTRDSQMLIAGDGNGVVYTWQVGSWQPLEQVATRTKMNSENLLALAHSPRRDWIAGGGRRNVVYVWEHHDQALSPVGELAEGHVARIQALAFSPTADVLASADKRGVIQLWDTTNFGRRSALLGHTERVWSVAWSPDGRSLACGVADGTIGVWNVSTSRDACDAYPALPTSVGDLSISPDGKWLVASCHDGSVHWFDTESRERVEKFELGNLSKTRFSPDGRLVALRLDSGELRVFTRDSREDLLHRPADRGRSGDELAWAPNGRSLAIDTESSKLVIIDMHTGAVEHKFSDGGETSGFAFSPNGQQIAAGGDRLRVWNIGDEKLILDLPCKGGGLFYSADSQLLAGEWQGTISIVDVTTGKRLRELVGKVDHMAVAFAPDGKTLAATIQNPAHIMLWDVRTGQELLSIEAPASRVTHLLFSPQGGQLIAAGQDQSGHTQIWQWSTHRTVPQAGRGSF